MTIPSLEDLRLRGAAQQPAWPDPAERRATRSRRCARCRRWSSPVSATTSRPSSPTVAAGQGLPAAGRRLRRDVRRRDGRERPRQAPGAAADGGRAHVRRLGAGREGRPDRRPVRQAALAATSRPARASRCRPTAATPSTATTSPTSSRIPDPQRLVQVYNSSAATLNLCRAFLQGGYADLRQMHAWNTDFVRTSPGRRRYEKLAGDIDRALDFMQAIGAESEELHRVSFHSSHEALILEYEHALTRIDSRTADAVRRLRSLRLDRGAHPPARRRRTSSCSRTSATRSASSSARRRRPTRRSRWPRSSTRTTSPAG